MNYRSIVKNIIPLVLVGFLTILFAVSVKANAQAPLEFLVDWRANTYVPSDYQGKALPTRGSRVDVTFELIDGGRIANISNSEVRWFINFNIQDRGLDKNKFSFTHDPASNRNPVIKIEVLNYKGQTLSHTFTIPISNPEVNIVSYDQRNFIAKPYFFNVKDINALNFSWTVNGIPATEELDIPNILSLEIPAIAEILNIIIDLRAVNKNNNLEFANQILNIPITP